MWDNFKCVVEYSIYLIYDEKKAPFPKYNNEFEI